MIFKIIAKVNWKEDIWNNIFNLVSDFRKEYSLKISSLDVYTKDSYHFSLGSYNINFTINTQGYWITFESNTDKSDFDEKFNFISERVDLC